MVSKRHSLKFKFFIASVILILIPTTIISLVNIDLFKKSSKDNYINYNIYTMRKVGSAIEGMLEELNSISLFLIGSNSLQSFRRNNYDESTQNILLLKNIQDTLTYLTTTNRCTNSIHIYGINGQSIYTGSKPPNLTNTDRIKAFALQGKPFWNIEYLNAVSGNKRRYIYHCRLLRHPSDLSNIIGILKIYIDEKEIQNIFTNDRDPNTHFFIMDKQNAIQISTDSEFSSNEFLSDFSYNDLVANDRGSFKTILNNREFYVTPYALPHTDWVVFSLSVLDNLQNQAFTMMKLFGVLASGCFMFCLVLAYIFSRRMLNPLNHISNLMKSIENEDFSVRFNINGKDEISVLAKQFNHMAQKIQSLINEVYIATIHKKEAQLRVLQEQMNPHFLYNSLDTIYWTAKMEKSYETSELVKALSKFFRLSLKNTGEFTKIEDELEHLKYYIMIQQQRAKKPFEFYVEMSPQTSGCKVVYRVLQPLIENSIMHGIKNIEDGKIKVDIFKSGSQLIYKISDNGRGVNLDDVNSLLLEIGENNRGFGIKNVNDRIRMAFGNEYGISFNNSIDGDTIVTVTQPFIKEDTND